MKLGYHCMKSVQIRSFFWSVFSCIRTEHREIRTRKNSVFGHFSCRVFIKHYATLYVILVFFWLQTSFTDKLLTKDKTLQCEVFKAFLSYQNRHVNAQVLHMRECAGKTHGNSNILKYWKIPNFFVAFITIATELNTKWNYKKKSTSLSSFSSLSVDFNPLTTNVPII